MDRVHELRIAIPKDEFQKMQADLATIGPPGMLEAPDQADRDRGEPGRQKEDGARLAGQGHQAVAASVAVGSTLSKWRP
jgi:hypothetical protein